MEENNGVKHALQSNASSAREGINKSCINLRMYRYQAATTKIWTEQILY